MELARERGVPARRVPATRSSGIRGAACTRASLRTSKRPRITASTTLSAAPPAAPLLVVLDSIEDPHNVGAILRTADAAGVDGVIRQSRRAASLDGAAAKASAGAVAHVRIAEVVNIARALEELKEAGVWTVGLAGSADTAYDAVDYTLPTAIVLGAEGSGLRRLVRERCDRSGVDPHAGSRREPECVGCRGGYTVRSGAPASGGTYLRQRWRLSGRPTQPEGLAGLAREVLLSALCLAGVAQAGRAADL